MGGFKSQQLKQRKLTEEGEGGLTANTIANGNAFQILCVSFFFWLSSLARAVIAASMRCEGGRNRSDDDDDGGPKLMPEVSIYAMLESRGNEQGERERAR